MVQRKIIRQKNTYKTYLNPNFLDEGNWMEVIKDNNNIEEIIVRCNNCGQPTKYGYTRMCGSFVGCDNKIKIDGKETNCFFGDLMPRVMKYKNSEDTELHKKYIEGKVYRWRDKNDG